jgi:hypothetical protein
MALGSCGHRITHQLRPINMNGRSILAVTSEFKQRKGEQTAIRPATRRFRRWGSVECNGKGRRDGSLLPLVPPGGAPLAGSLLVVSKQSRATRLPPAGNWVRFACQIPPLFVLSHSLPMVNTMGKLALFWRFSITATSLPSGLTDHYSLATRFTSHVPRPTIVGVCRCRAPSWEQHSPPGRRSTCYDMLRFPVSTEIWRA